jgi:repressor LexA
VTEVRDMLARLAGARGESLAALSRLLRRNPAYLQQFVQRGSPRRLADDDIATLADHFGVEPSLLGGAAAADLVAVPYLSVRASAGRGLAAEGEALIRTEPFARSLLREAGIAPADASMIAAEGESMVPTILSGDRLLVDRSDRGVRDGSIYVVRHDEALSVKRLEREGPALRLVSDNPAYPPVRVPRAELAVIGAVKLLIRRPA